MQLQVAKDIIAKDGTGGLYKGLSAGLLRQATYTTARLGIFQIFSDMLKQQNQGKVSYIAVSYRHSKVINLFLLIVTLAQGNAEHQMHSAI